MAVRPINASRFAEILEQWKKDCLQDNDQQSADVIFDVILQLDDMPTLTPPNEWVSVEAAVPDPGERVLATDGIFVGEAYRTSADSWHRHTGFPWRDGVTGRTVKYWMLLPAPPDRCPPEGEV